ncbi:hypothetical protein BKA70DRAFT_796542 [Coprinopsis sp. MPI-PUGE-AT-0042]|nr:hypothetical protein BKA70DRAFT_796542 [Coprinopsis sp. MPI-PUGE-AT-0042]
MQRNPRRRGSYHGNSPSTPAAPSWRPNLTISRSLLMVATLALGTAKAATAYTGGTIVPATLELVMATVVFTMFLLFSSLETREAIQPRWFFKDDVIHLLRGKPLIKPPSYQTVQADANLFFKPPHPPITGYRLLVSCLVFGFGLFKATLSYLGRTTEATTTELVFGTAITISLYYLGLYEESPTRLMPSLFERNYARQVHYTVRLMTLIAWTILGLVITSGWTSFWGWSIYFQSSVIIRIPPELLAGSKWRLSEILLVFLQICAFLFFTGMAMTLVYTGVHVTGVHLYWCLSGCPFWKLWLSA